MIKLQNTSRFAFTVLMVVVVVGFSFAAGGEGEKEKNKNGKDDPKKSSVTVLDSNSLDKKYDIPNAKDQVDDTLVYEDWDGNGGGGDDDGRSSGAYQGGNDVGGSKGRIRDGLNISAAEATDVFKKTYRVEFSVYPNPVVNELHIKPEQAPQSLQVTNLVGGVQIQGEYSPIVNVSELASGTYFIQLIYPDRHVESRKFIKY